MNVIHQQFSQPPFYSEAQPVFSYNNYIFQDHFVRAICANIACEYCREFHWGFNIRVKLFCELATKPVVLYMVVTITLSHLLGTPMSIQLALLPIFTHKCSLRAISLFSYTTYNTIQTQWVHIPLEQLTIEYKSIDPSDKHIRQANKTMTTFTMS